MRMSYAKLLKDFFSEGFFTTKLPRKDHKPVNITPDIKSVVVRHKNHNMLIKRNQDNDARIPELFTRTSRPCPPFCIQPMNIADDVETVGELEVLDYLAAASNGRSDIMIVDSRLEKWVDRGTIPGAVEIPWTDLALNQGATTKGILAVLKHHFNVRMADDIEITDVENAIEKCCADVLFDYSAAKTLVLFCNGAWCGQTSESIDSLLKFGYPADKLKYYRNGMQGWVNVGLTTVSQGKNDLVQCELK